MVNDNNTNLCKVFDNLQIILQLFADICKNNL